MACYTPSVHWSWRRCTQFKSEGSIVEAHQDEHKKTGHCLPFIGAFRHCATGVDPSPPSAPSAPPGSVRAIIASAATRGCYCDLFLPVRERRTNYSTVLVRGEITAVETTCRSSARARPGPTRAQRAESLTVPSS
ncbi:hypothetical protein EVAR_6944_1 [Eumeta japonica]|uniref:Uncharacterized protein n=1 Tax=Eumeta variegata TaxID=151549 RepID=A0A4C1THK3_EUMVA|nr:hypothetical protein EVAR_6944_1 [Eumeta japonica]